VIVAMAVLVAGVLGTLGILDAARSTAASAQRTSAADAVAQREIEAMRALPYAALYDCALPAPSPDPKDPRHYVTAAGALLVQQDYRGTTGAVLTGVPPTGEPFWSGTCTATAGVDPGPSAFTSGGVRGRVYRFVTAEGVPCSSGLSAGLTSGESGATGVDVEAGTVGLALTTSLSTTLSGRVSLFCQPGATEGKRLTVAVALDGAPIGAPGPHRPVYLSTLVADPAAGPLSF
jgi:hypothetical protein